MRETELADQADTFKLRGSYSGMAILTVYKYFF